MAQTSVTVRRLAIAPVKGLRVSNPAEVLLTRDGVRGDRSFYLVDERGRMVNGKRLNRLQAVSAEIGGEGALLSLRFPSGAVCAGAVELGEELQTRFFSEERSARVVRGEFATALSEFAGRTLRVVADAHGRSAVDRGTKGAMTLVSQASLRRLEGQAGGARLDARRFRMTAEVDGLQAHEEDGWVGSTVELGEALVRPAGHVGRCTVTTLDPDTGESDLPTLDLLRSYRSQALTSEPLAFGIYGQVLREGRVRVGDAVRVGG